MTPLHIIFIALVILGVYLTLTDAKPTGLRRTVWIIIWTMTVIQMFIPDLLTQG